MRPLSLEIEGLRSFRAPQAIDFDGREHIAIVGDTGAGKSSILEALTFALYGRTTFTGQGNQELMNATSTALRVVLRFEVAGGRWRVARTLRRSGTGQVGSAAAVLQRLDADDAVVEAWEQVKTVNAEVAKLLGLDVDAFLRTVVLPQGQFARLLVDDDQRARAAVLRQIWRTDELVAAGARADEALRELVPLQARVEQALVTEPDDPAAHLSALRADAATLAAAAAAARDRREAARTEAVRHEEARRRADLVAELAARLAGWDAGAAVAEAAAVAADAAAAATTRAVDEAADAEARRRLAAVPADDDGPDLDAVARHDAALAALPTLIADVDEAGAAADEAGAAVAAAGAGVAAAAAAVAAATAAVAEATTGRRRLADAAEACLAAVREGTTRLAEARRAATAVEAARSAVADRRRAVEAAAAAAEGAAHAADAAARAATEAEAALADASRADAAATAAHGHAAGDPCPVCARSLPASWSAPEGPDLGAARAGATAARTAAAEAAGARRVAEERVAAALRALADAEATAGTAGEVAADARRALARRLADVPGAPEAEAAGAGDPVPSMPAGLRAPAPDRTAGAAAPAEAGAPGAGGLAGAEPDVGDLHRPDAEVLRPLLAVAEQVAAALAAAEEAVRACGDEEGAARTAQAGAEAAAEAARQRQEERARQLRRAAARRDAALAALPAALHPPAGADAGASVAAARAELAGRRGVLEARRAEREAAHGELDRLRRLRDGHERAAAAVEARSRAVWAATARQRDRARAACEALALPAPPAPADELPASPDLATAVDAVGRAVRAAAAAVAAAGAEADDAARDAVGALAALSAPLGLGAVDPAEVVRAADDAHLDAEVAARRAAEEAEGFAARRATVERLRDAAARLDAAHLALADLSAALKDGAFPKWLTLRRSRDLLVHASLLLGQMTAGRYAFADLDDEAGEWAVIDGDSGVARSPASLSGGEKFVASLALALGMVEMMARSGGHVESLFLDEGFGALDRQNLDAAVEALATAAAGGRLVATISHVRAVAEQVDHVLSVTRDPRGTRVRWLDAAERRALALDDLAGEAAVAGLLE